jgi:hypothetical protein
MASSDPADSPLASAGFIQSTCPSPKRYRKYWWPAHEKSNEQWIAAIEPKVSEIVHELQGALSKGCEEQIWANS